MIEATIILGGIILRLVPHVPNFSSISATALFAGAHLKKRYAVILPLLAVAISDYLLLYLNPFATPALNLTKIHPITSSLHATTFYVWGSFIISGLIGLWLRNRLCISNLLIASLTTSLQFYLITNFGVWATGWYGHGIDGLFLSYAMGLPFLRWTILGDLFYTTAFFSIYLFATKLHHRLNLNRPSTINV